MFKSSPAKTPEEYLELLEEPRKTEIKKLHAFIRKTVPTLAPFMQSGMIGYGQFHYKYASGREGDWPLIALASQKNYISVYVCAVDGNEYLAEKHKDQLPRASIGKSCIRFKRVEDIDFKVLGSLLKEAKRLGGFAQTDKK